METKFICWGEGDRTVGDGTFGATLSVDLSDDKRDIKLVKDTLRVMLSMLWDLRPGRVHIMTGEEWEIFQKQEAEDNSD